MTTVPVTEADRELVAKFLEADGGWTTNYVVNIRSGAYDKCDNVQLVAISRIAAEIEGARKMREAAMKCCDFEVYEGEQAWFARDKIDAAISALDPAQVIKGEEA